MNIEKIVSEIVDKYLEQNSFQVEIEVSARHVHLSNEDISKLFGEGYELTFDRALSQPGQYLCKERINIVGTKGVLTNVAILGPARNKTQVEVSKSDALATGLTAILRSSGETDGTKGCVLTTKTGSIIIEEGVIVAKNHIHVKTSDAQKFGITDGQIVSVEYESERSTVFKNVLIRVDDNFETRMHIDFDEANAICFCKNKPHGKVVIT